jgi:putative ABC transport system permease protein
LHPNGSSPMPVWNAFPYGTRPYATFPGEGLMAEFWSDIRMASRKLLREPHFLITALLSLALGIGANSAIFTVVHGVLLRPLPFSEPDRLVAPHAVLRGEAYDIFSGPVFLALQEHATTLSAVGLVASTSATLADGSGEPAEISGAAVSANYFDVLGLPPQRGRLFRAGENEPGASPVVLLSQGLWQQRFGAAEDAVGRTIELNGVPREVVGIMPASASIPPEHRYWVPLPYTPGFRNPNNVLALSYRLVARLAPGATVAEASADVARIVELAKQEAGMDNPHYTGSVRPLRDAYVGTARMPLFVLLAAVGCVLLIVCANLANLLLAQAATRTTDFAVRRALGATPARLMRQLLTEGLVLSLAGGALGLLVAVWGAPALLALLPPDMPRMPDIGINSTVLLFTFGSALLAGLLFSLAPALHARSAAAPMLRQGGRGLAGGRGARTRSALVLAQTAVAFALVIAAGLLIRSLAELRQVDPGFTAHNALTYELSFPAARYDSHESVLLATDAILEGTRALPGVIGAGAIQHLPLGGWGNRITFSVEGREEPPEGEGPSLLVGVATPGYFEAMGIPLRRGRLFEPTDQPDGLPVALLSEAAAARHFPGEDPIGRRIVMHWTPAGSAVQGVVVGIVGDVRHDGLRTASDASVYFPLAQVPFRYMAMVVRTAGDPQMITRAVTAAVHEVDPRLAVSELQPLSRVVAASVATDRFVTALLAAFSIIALLLAAIGIFGVISYGVAQRRREIGVRLAVGASGSHIIRMVVGNAMKLAGAGMLVGGLAALAITRLLQALLFGVRPTDVATYTAAGAVLLGVALLASMLPALRAARVPPASVLNAE